MPSPDTVVRIDASDDLHLASSRRAALVDIRLPERGAAPPTGRPDARIWLASLAGATVETSAIGPADRWGRVAMRLALPGAGGGIDVAELLVAVGLAQVDSGERGGLCRPDLLAIEDRARRARRGLWAEGTALLAAEEPDALRGQEGRFVVVQGRIVSVGERSARTYLNFGRDFARDFAVTVPRREWAAMKRAGLSAETLRGRTVRVRGTVEVRRGPSMEIVVPDMIERLADAGDRPR